MLRLRPYKPGDAGTILAWCRDETAFRKWTGDRYASFPITEADMNEKYFCRYFRSMTERTPIDYLNYYRIECACEMLTTKNISVKEAAISCGFNDESYFIKTFHKYKGITPKQFMKAEF